MGLPRVGSVALLLLEGQLADEVVDDPGASPAPDEPVDDPGSPPADETDVDAESSPDEAEGEGESDETDEPEPEEFAKFLAKHKGDKKAAGRHYWAVQQQNAAMRAEIDELRAAKAREPEKPPEPDPSVVELDRQITALEAVVSNAVPTREAALLKEYNEARDEEAYFRKTVTRLESPAEASRRQAAGEDLKDLQAEIRATRSDHNAARAALASVQARYETFASEVRATNKELAALKAQRTEVAQRVDRTRAAEKERSVQSERFQESFPGYIEAVVTQAAKTAGVRVTDHLKDNVNAKLVRLVAPYHRQGREAEEVDWAAHVRAIVAEEKAALDEATRTRLARPRSTSSPTSRPGQPVQPTRNGRTSTTPAANDRAAIEARIAANNRAARERLVAIEARRARAG